MSDLTGQQIGNYRILSLVGRGGMGQVYLAQHVHLQRTVAVKVIHPALAIDPEFRDRFLREARAPAPLSHPHILYVFDYGEAQGQAYLVMEYAGGGSLRQELDQPQLGLAARIELVMQTAEGLAFAHARGVIHRDIKPDNLLLVADQQRPTIKIGDFGLAQLVSGPGLLTTDVVAGTPAYMAPEQFQGTPIDGRADVYALGVVLYELITGALPFSVESPLEAAYKHLHEPPPRPRDLRPELPAALEALVLRCLAKQPADRPAADELAEALRAGLAEWSLPGQSAAVFPSAGAIIGAPELPRSLQPAAQPQLAVFDLHGQLIHSLSVTGDGLMVGSSPDSDLVLAGSSIAPSHLFVEYDGQQVSVSLQDRAASFQIGQLAARPGRRYLWEEVAPLRIGTYWLRLIQRRPATALVAERANPPISASGPSPRIAALPAALKLEVEPQASTGTRRASFTILLTNTGSATASARLSAEASIPAAALGLPDQPIQLAPGATFRGRVQLRAPLHWFGTPRRHTLTTSARTDQRRDTQQAAATFEQRALIGAPALLLAAPALLLVASLSFLALAGFIRVFQGTAPPDPPVERFPLWVLVAALALLAGAVILAWGLWQRRAAAPAAQAPLAAPRPSAGPVAEPAWDEVSDAPLIRPSVQLAGATPASSTALPAPGSQAGAPPESPAVVFFRVPDLIHRSRLLILEELVLHAAYQELWGAILRANGERYLLTGYGQFGGSALLNAALERAAGETEERGAAVLVCYCRIDAERPGGFRLRADLRRLGGQAAAPAEPDQRRAERALRELFDLHADPGSQRELAGMLGDQALRADRIVVVLDKLSVIETLEQLGRLALLRETNPRVLILAVARRESFDRWQAAEMLQTRLRFQVWYFPGLSAAALEEHLFETPAAALRRSADWLRFRRHVDFIARGVLGRAIDEIRDSRNITREGGRDGINLSRVAQRDDVRHNAWLQEVLELNWRGILGDIFAGPQRRADEDRARLGIYALLDWIAEARRFSAEQSIEAAERTPLTIADDHEARQRVVRNLLQVLASQRYLELAGAQYAVIWDSARPRKPQVVSLRRKRPSIEPGGTIVFPESVRALAAIAQAPPAAGSIAMPAALPGASRASQVFNSADLGPFVRQFANFEIVIRPAPQAEAIYPLEVRSPGGALERSEFRLPFDQTALELRVSKLKNARLQVRATTRRSAPLPEEREHIRHFGRELFDALFHGPVRTSYDLSLSQAVQQRCGLRIKLVIQPPELAQIPWELLCDHRNGQHLCLSSLTPIIRFMELEKPYPPLAIQRPLNILATIASPDGLPQLDVERERANLERSLGDLIRQQAIRLTWLGRPTLGELRAALLAGEWHIFHFLGHGGRDSKRGQGFLVLSDEGGEAHRIYADDFQTTLCDHPSLRLAVLNACDGGVGSSEHMFSSTAATLVRGGIPAVLAMQDQISDEAAIEFAQHFYTGLSRGYPIDIALTEARKALSVHSIEWATPTLSMRADEWALFQLSAEF